MKTKPKTHVIQAVVLAPLGIGLLFTPLMEWGVIILLLGVIFLVYGLIKMAGKTDQANKPPKT